MIYYDGKLDRIYQYLFIAACFFLPLTVVLNNIAIWLITIIWLLSGNYSAKLIKVKNNKLAVASIVFFLVHVLGLMWSENIAWGVEILRKMLPFLLVLPILLTITKSQNIKFYTLAFLIAIGISESASYLIWFGIIEPFKYATIENPTPMMSHISYNPFLAFAIYLVINELLNRKNMKQYERGAYTFFLLTMTFNMFITGGRAGQIMFFVAVFLLAFQYFKSSQIKAVFSSIFLISVISVTAYYSSPTFHERVNLGYEEITKYDSKRDVESPYIHTSIGLRINFFINSLEMFQSSPIIGVGTGDFPNEYSKINKVNSPFSTETSHPHNMYMLVLAQLGLIGFVSFMWMFYNQFKIAISSNNLKIQNIGIAIPILFFTIMWSDSYLLGHYTANLFILFSSFVYAERLDAN